MYTYINLKTTWIKTRIICFGKRRLGTKLLSEPVLNYFKLYIPQCIPQWISTKHNTVLIMYDELPYHLQSMLIIVRF